MSWYARWAPTELQEEVDAISKSEDRLITQEDLDLFLLVHRAMLNDVRAFARVVPGLQPGESDRVRSLSNWFYFVQRTVELHHEGEDRDLCPLLTVKDPSFAQHQARIVKDHTRLKAEMGEVKQDLDLLAQDQDGDFVRQRDELASKFNAVLEFLEGHIGHEEEDLVSCAKSCITYRELRHIEREGGKKTPIKDLALVLPWIVAAGDETERRKVMAVLPLPLRLVYRFWWRPRFERMSNPLTTA